MKPQKIDKSKTSLLDFGLILFTLTVCLYCTIFSFLAGAYSYYKIPAGLIRLDTTVLLIVGFSIIGNVFQLYLFIEAFLRFADLNIADNEKTTAIKTQLTVLAGFMYFFLHQFLKGVMNTFYINWLNYGSWIMFILTILAIWLIKNKKTGKNKPKEGEPNNGFELDEYLKPKIGFKPKESFGYLTLLCVTMYFTGYTRAAIEKDYSVINTKPEMLVIDVTTDNLICKTFDRKKGTFDENIVLLAKENISKSKIKSQYIGQLRYEKTPEMFGPVK